MSTQADKIKAFRLAQRARIQKEEEEEWISGEELCTEGSSDEESKCKLTCGRKKQKKTNQLMISPLTLPNKNIDTSEKEDSEISIALPSINDNNKIVVGANIKQDNKEPVAKMSLEESLKINADADFCVQWRPKRGSLKLPTVSEGQSFYNMVHETNSFHRDMLINLKNMRHKFTTKKIHDEKDALDLERMHAFRFKQKMLADIDQRDEEINRLDIIVEEIKKERLKTYGEIEDTEIESESENQKQSQVFTNFCQIKITDDINNNDIYDKDGTIENVKNNENAEEDKTAENDVTETSELNSGAQRETKNKKFIERNIELSKHGRMAGLSLTDEEKIKLDELLSDLDLEEAVAANSNVSDNNQIDNHEQLVNMTDLDIDKITEDSKNCANPYRLDLDEERRLNEMETKMKEYLNSGDDDVSRKSAIENENAFDKFYESGKLWKYDLINKRLKEIDKELTIISENKAKEETVDFEREIKIQYEIDDALNAVENDENPVEK